ncbi:hypothetical protein MW887_009104 [Aspergillus wentii]|nr:hypothetical protein MW887_009104 [Aspergillus wentii]
MSTTKSHSPSDMAEGEPKMSNGARRRQQRAMPGIGYDNDYAPRVAEVPRGQPVSHKNNPAAIHGNRVSRSFSTRAGEIPPGDKRNLMNKPLPPDPSELPEGYAAEIRYATESEASTAAPDTQGEGTLDSTSQHSQLNRSNTTRSSKEQQHDWAPDRSPLQKLEVTLTGISKEEKRARVQEAERRLKEKLARQKMEAEGGGQIPAQPRESAAPGDSKSGTTMPERTASNRSTKYGQPTGTYRRQEPKRPTHQRFASEGYGELEVPRQRPAEKPISTHNRSASVRYSGPRPGEESQYANAGAQYPGQNVNRGNVPRRSVTVSHQPGPYGANMRPAQKSAPRDTFAPGWDSSQANQLPAPSQRAVPRKVDPKMQQQPLYPGPGNRQGRPAQQATREPGTYANFNGAAPFTAPVGFGFNDQALDKENEMTQNTQDELSSQQPKPKRQTVSFNVPPPTPPPLSEWKNAPAARLCASDFDFQNFDMDRSKAWWEGGGNKGRRQSRSLPINYQKPTQKLNANKSFQPPLFLKSGPLLRYTGMKRVQIDGPNGPFDKETWRGSVMIVTKDSRSSYNTPPTLRLFSQPMDLLPPPPVEVKGEEGAALAPEYVDPTAGLMKLGRDGRPLYVKPVEHTEEEMDLCFIENDDGIFELSASIIDYSSDGIKQAIPANRIHSMDGEAAGVHKDISGFRLYADPDRDVTFWRFNLEVELGPIQQRIAYRINQGPALGFWVPAKGQSMNIMFHNGNGFRPNVDTDRFCGPDPLWRDILNEHQTRPFHVMVGGGDQIFNDQVTAESSHFQDWIKIKNLNDRYDAPFDPEFRAEIENAYLENYSAWFSQGLFSLATSQIPAVNMWNDHEILEGYGSYPEEFMQTPVISGLGRIAFKYYLLFQHHSVPEETEADEPSWLLGAEPGPYIREKSRSLFMSMGKGVAFLGLDCRTERTSNEVISETTCDRIWDRCHREIIRGETKHLIVLLSIPIAYPRVAMLKNILNSRKSLGKAGMFGGLVNKNGGKVEIYDDHWTAKHHKSERTWLIEDLQDLAAEKSVRVTILSGDVHLAAIGQFNSNPKLDLAKDKDYRYMPNVISSAIANQPETEMVSDMLNKRNRVHHVDTNTDEDMIPIFTQDVDGKPRNNKRLLPRRNWCSIREYQPGFTPPATPESEEEPEPRPGMLKRTLSLTRGDKPAGGGILRRLSLRGPPPTKEFNLGGNNAPGRRMSMDGPFPPAETGDSQFPTPTATRPNSFLRRPTNVSQKSKKAVQAEDDGAGAMVNLEGGLSVTFNMELNPKDPAGITTPYKLLVPMLRYEGYEYDPPAAQVAKGWRKWLGVRRKKDRKDAEEGQDGASDEEDDYEDPEEGDDYDEDSDQGEDEDDDMPPETIVPVGQAAVEPDEQTKQAKKKWFGRLR